MTVLKRRRFPIILEKCTVPSEEPGWHSWYMDWGMGWMTWCSNPSRGKRFFFSPKPTGYFWGSPSILLNG
jgi:hypothetical protein